MSGLRDRFEAAIGGDGADPRWADQLDELLYDGETVRETVTVGDARVVVTSHRVLAFTPGAETTAFRQVDRPNVLGVSTGARGEDHLLARGARWGLIGLVLLGAGLLLDMDAIVGDLALGDTAGSQLGVGGVIDLVRAILGLLRRLDDLLAIAGALVLALAAVAVGAYWLTRERTLVIALAGDEADIHLPRTDGDGRVRERLERAIAPGPEA